MKLTELGLVEFLNEIDSKSPAPGGGSVSALAGALGACLLRMVGHLSIGKKRYEALDELAKQEFSNTFLKMERLKEEMISLIDKDTEAFNLVMAAFKLSKESETEKKYRNEQIQIATIKAIEVPLQVAKTAYTALRLIDPVIKYGNPNTLSDIGVAVLMLASGIEGAILNVKINLPGLIDMKMARNFQTEVNDLLEKASSIKQISMLLIHESLKLNQ